MTDADIARRALVPMKLAMRFGPHDMMSWDSTLIPREPSIGLARQVAMPLVEVVELTDGDESADVDDDDDDDDVDSEEKEQEEVMVDEGDEGEEALVALVGTVRVVVLMEQTGGVAVEGAVDLSWVG